MAQFDTSELPAPVASNEAGGLSGRLAISSVFGPPRDAATWSGAPNNLAVALEKLGVDVVGVHPRVTKARKLMFAGQYVMSGYGWLDGTEALLRSPAVRDFCARTVSTQARALGARHVLHTGTLDLPETDLQRGIRHYLYCDQTWNLSLQYRPDRARYSEVAVQRFEELERRAYDQMQHIFTFGDYVRKNLIEHYGVVPERVTAVGSGTGRIEPYEGEKNYAEGCLLFVAKHLFAAKGGFLVLEAMKLIAARRPGLKLVIVGDDKYREFIGAQPNVEIRGRLTWDELQNLYRSARLLVQPMINDPWGQVYLEALLSRTPVVGLNRNGLPEITQWGRHGFFVDQAEPWALAAAVLEAVENPTRLARMGASGQRYVLENHGWDRVARRVHDVIARA
jgi:glycosyltransferase involved in cell wall biosynthesis